MCDGVLFGHRKNELLCGSLTSLEHILSSKISDTERLIVRVLTSTQKLWRADLGGIESRTMVTEGWEVWGWGRATRGCVTGSGTGEMTSNNSQQPHRDTMVDNIGCLLPNNSEARISNVPNTKKQRWQTHSSPWSDCYTQCVCVCWGISLYHISVCNYRVLIQSRGGQEVGRKVRWGTRRS